MGRGESEDVWTMISFVIDNQLKMWTKKGDNRTIRLVRLIVVTKYIYRQNDMEISHDNVDNLIILLLVQIGP